LLNELTAFEHTDTHAGISLGGVKRLEQAVPDKIVIHPAAGIPDVNNTKCIPLIEPHLNLAIFRRRLLGIIDQVSQNLRQAHFDGNHAAFRLVDGQTRLRQPVPAFFDHLPQQRRQLDDEPARTRALPKLSLFAGMSF